MSDDHTELREALEALRVASLSDPMSVGELGRVAERARFRAIAAAPALLAEVDELRAYKERLTIERDQARVALGTMTSKLTAIAEILPPRPQHGYECVGPNLLTTERVRAIIEGGSK